MNKQEIEFKVEGCIDVSENPVSIDELTDKFILWLESNHWYFGGGINEYKEENQSR